MTALFDLIVHVSGFTQMNQLRQLVSQKKADYFRPLLEEQHTMQDRSEQSRVLKAGETHGRRDGFSLAVCSSMRYSSPGGSTRKQGQADDRGLRSEILPRSPAQSTVLFSSGRG